MVQGHDGVAGGLGDSVLREWRSAREDVEVDLGCVVDRYTAVVTVATHTYQAPPRMPPCPLACMAYVGCAGCKQQRAGRP